MSRNVKEPLIECVWQKISAFQLSWYFDIVQLSTVETSTLVLNVQKFRETYKKSYRNTEIFDIC